MHTTFTRFLFPLVIGKTSNWPQGKLGMPPRRFFPLLYNIRSKTFADRGVRIKCDQAAGYARFLCNISSESSVTIGSPVS